MKKITLFFFLIIFSIGNAQTVKEKLENSQGQDLNVPAPPKITFPAQYEKGNKVFVEEVRKNLNQNVIKDLPKTSITQITLKIDADGNLINISTYGTNKTFNDEVRNAVKKTALEKWIPGKNSKGEQVTNILRFPFKISK